MRTSDRILKQHAASWPRSKLRDGVAARMSGPGGLYNSGNLIGLVSGLALQMVAASGGAGEAAASFFAGSASALWMTGATLIFMVSGEAYHRAWRFGFPPDKPMNWWGDFLSGIGALALGMALFSLGQPLLALTAGLLHAIGKFGSALHGGSAEAGLNWPRLYRQAVVASRVPAIFAALLALINASNDQTMLAPVTLLVCYALWVKADLMLLKG
ncbi:MAG: hypothetical protein WCC66_04490 [Rhizobiaceae bacterium]